MSSTPIISLLREKGSPRVLSHMSLRKMVERHVRCDAISATALIASLVDVKAVHKVDDGIYLNYKATPLPSPAEALRYVVTGGVLSLQTVLGQSGVLNNPTSMYTCVRPAFGDEGEGQHELVGRRYSTNNPAPLFHVFTVNEQVATVGLKEDNIDASFSYPRATIERAFADWLYLATPDVDAMGSEPPLDCDMELMDMPRLRRVVESMGITHRLDMWLDRHNQYLADADVDANMSSRLGF